VPIAQEPGNAEEEGAVAYLITTIAEGADADVGSAGQTTALHRSEEVTESHRWGFYHPAGRARRRLRASAVQSETEGPIPRHFSEKSAILAKAGAAT